MFRGTAAPMDGGKRWRAASRSPAHAARCETAAVSLRPRVLQARDAVEHRADARVIDAIGDEVAVALELEALVALAFGQRRLEPGLHLGQAARVEGLPE